jgi:hypothetical protein
MQVLTLRDLAMQGEQRRMQMEDYPRQREQAQAKYDLDQRKVLADIGKSEAATAASQASTSESQVKREREKQAYLNETVRGPAMAAYNAAIDAGMNHEQATQRAQATYSQGLQASERSGLFSVEEKGQFQADFDRDRVLSRLQQSKSWIEGRKAAAPQRSERIAGEQLIQEERDPITGAVRQVGSGPRFNPRPAVQVTNEIREGDKRFEKENKLRDDYKADPNVKSAAEMNNAFKLIEAAYQRPSAANDLAMATKYMKILDPTSVVRESEFALAISATGLLDKVQNYAAAVIEGKKLNPNQRKDFYESAKAINESFQSGVKDIENQYSDIAKGYGLEPKNVIPSLRRRKSDGDGPLNDAEKAELAALRARLKK